MDARSLKAFLDSKVEEYNNPSFIENDPISIPHSFSKKEDIEITGFWTAILSWGQRKTIINKCRELFGYMDNEPHAFALNHSDADLKRLLHFKHRTFNTTDTLYFISFFKWFYSNHNSLEEIFVAANEKDMQVRLNRFHEYFCSLSHFPARTRKHIPSPNRNSACKRINMFLRWMARNDNKGVDFGIWKQISPADLICPCDVHVQRVARRLKLINRKQSDWKMAIELTENLRKFDPNDPVKYDYALFGLGLEEKRESLSRPVGGIYSPGF